MKLCKSAALAVVLAVACGRGDVTGPNDRDSLMRDRPVLAIGVDSTTGASIETNKDDYMPGEVVHLVGRGWSPNETVNLHMTEEPNTHADVDTNVVADAAGGFSIHFYDVQPHDLGVTFTLTATGETSQSVAIAIFTDGAWNLTLTTFTPTSPSPSAAFDVSGSIAITGSGENTWKASEWWIDAGTKTCVNLTPDVTKSPPSTQSFSLTGLTAPSSPGAHTLWVQLWETDDCSDPAGPGNGKLGGEKDFAFTVAGSQANGAPTVSAGSDKNVAEGSPISLGGGAPNGAAATDPDSDPLTYAWTADVSAMDPNGGCVFSPSATVLAPSVTCDDDSNAGTVKLTLTVDDGQGHVVSDFLLLTVTNANPTANAGSSYSGTEGGSIALSGSGDDPAGNDDGALTYLWSVDATGIDANGSCTVANATSATLATVTCDDDGSFTVSLTVSDDDGGSNTATVNLTVGNANPVATISNGPYSGPEGSAIALTGSGDDAGNNDDAGLTYLWTVNYTGIDADGLCTITNETQANASITCTDDSNDGNFSVSLKVSDDDGGEHTVSVNLSVANAMPAVTLNTPSVGQLFSLLNGPISVSAGYTDAGGNDSHQCEFTLNGAVDNTVPYFSPLTAGTCAGTIVAPEAGVYTLIVNVKDDDTAVGTASVMIVVYDPSAGFVTGGGWINSPAQAYRADPALVGKANFGFVSKYKKGATSPEGNTEFQFHTGGLNFHSSTYQWLVVNQAGTNAQFKGIGTINGLGSYTFMLWATDGGNSNDKFRIQITDNNNANAVVYDNGSEQVIAGGSIVIHTGGKK
jgi:hypothetical protein